MTPFVWIVAAIVLGGSPRPAKMATIFPQALLILSAFVALQWAMERRRPLPREAAFQPRRGRRPELLDRLPEKLNGAELHAIEAEDHYLRLHTDRGSALVLMRLADAMAELEGLEGARTHRSWWVARDAVLHASRGRGRALLKLKGGLEAPVSRTYAPLLRRAGWF
jgi:DNA-binding LytR/AlgR family response regulator